MSGKIKKHESAGTIKARLITVSILTAAFSALILVLVLNDQKTVENGWSLNDKLSLFAGLPLAFLVLWFTMYFLQHTLVKSFPLAEDLFRRTS